MKYVFFDDIHDGEKRGKAAETWAAIRRWFLKKVRKPKYHMGVDFGSKDYSAVTVVCGGTSWEALFADAFIKKDAKVAKTDIYQVAEKMAAAIREWNQAKQERENWKHVVGQIPPVGILGSAKKANAMLTEALEEYESFVVDQKRRT